MTGIRIVQNAQQMIGGNKMGIFGVKPARGKGKNEKQILSDLALKAAQDEASGLKQLSPSEVAFIKRLQSNSLALFMSYKKKFAGTRGPNFSTRMPNFPGNQQGPSKFGETNRPEKGFLQNRPNFMDDDED